MGVLTIDYFLTPPSQARYPREWKRAYACASPFAGVVCQNTLRRQLETNVLVLRYRILSVDFVSN